MLPSPRGDEGTKASASLLSLQNTPTRDAAVTLNGSPTAGTEGQRGRGFAVSTVPPSPSPRQLPMPPCLPGPPMLGVRPGSCGGSTGLPKRVHFLDFSGNS